MKTNLANLGTAEMEPLKFIYRNTGTILSVSPQTGDPDKGDVVIVWYTTPSIKESVECHAKRIWFQHDERASTDG
ncbi:hypothetical protein RUM44_006689 [Polyplax serrata]|uniref:Uncharacterized protein n=1 Tax=Polyplax serrata TaxID=468196 RepID=A0ABR1AIU5_POLSC